MPAHSPVPPNQATIALSYASSQSSTTPKSNYSSQLCLLIDQHHTNKQLYRSVMPAQSPAPPKQQIQLSVMRVHSPAPPKQATIALSYASSQSSTTETSNHSSRLCQLIVQHHPYQQLHLSVMPANNQAPPKQATKVLSYASSQSSTTQTSNNSSQLCQLTVQHHPNKQLQLSVMPAHSPAPPKQATIALSYGGSESSTTQTSNHRSQLSQLIVQHHPNKQLQLTVMPAHCPALPKQATIALSYASSQSSTTQSSNYSFLLCQLIVQHHPNKQPQLSVLPAHSQAPPKQATIALSFASSQSSTTQTSNYSSQFCKLIVQHHPNKQLQLSVMPAHSPAPPNQATIALRMPAHSPAPPKEGTIALSYASSQCSTTQTSNYSSQSCQLIVQYHPIKQPQLSVMLAHSPAPPQKVTIALSYASSQSTTIQTSNYSSQLCQLIVQHHPNKQPQLSVMPAHSLAPPNQATIALCYASSQSSITQTSNHSSQFCQLTVKHHPNRQPQLSVMPAHSPAPLKQATIALSYASSQSSTTQTSNHSSQLCQLIVQHHSNKQPQLSVMPVHSLAPLKQATIALSYASSSQSSSTQTSNYSSQLCQLTVQHHPNKQLQLSVMPAHSPAPPKQATIALSYASSQSSTNQTSNQSSQLWWLRILYHPKQATIALSYASSQSSTTQTSNYSSQL